MEILDLANYHKFAKVSSAKIPGLILNNMNVEICQSLAVTKSIFVVNSPNARKESIYQNFPLYSIFQQYICYLSSAVT